MHLESKIEKDNDLLYYLRSLDPDMVTLYRISSLNLPLSLSLSFSVLLLESFIVIAIFSLQYLHCNQVTELSRPSSAEVEEIIQHLVQSILHRFFKDETAGFLEDSAIGKPCSHPAVNVEHCDNIETSRDYLAKLLFWYFIGYLTCYAVSFLACVVIYHHHYMSFIPILFCWFTYLY